MPNNIIRDGQTRTAHLVGEKDRFDWITFTYRPMLGEDFATIEDAVEKADTPRKGVHLGCAVICDHLETWSEVDEKGREVPISLGNMRRLHWVVRSRVYAVICGIKATDPFPDPTDKEEDELLTRLHEEVDGSGETLDEGTAKN